MSKKLVFCDSISYCKAFDNVGRATSSWKDIERASLVILPGGSDVDPSKYGEKRNSKTYCSQEADERDISVWEQAKANNIPVVGICRGSQLLSVLNGGKIVQHVNHHHGNHLIETQDGERLLSNSIHHQMALPNKERSEIIAWATPRLSNVYEHGTGEYDLEEIEKEYEIVYYPDSKSLGIQGHPEGFSAPNEFVKYCQSLVKRFFGLG